MFKNIYNFIDIDKAEEIKTFNIRSTKKLVATINQIPHYIVSFLDLIPSEEDLENNKIIAKRNICL